MGILVSLSGMVETPRLLGEGSSVLGTSPFGKAANVETPRLLGEGSSVVVLIGALSSWVERPITFISQPFAFVLFLVL